MGSGRRAPDEGLTPEKQRLPLGGLEWGAFARRAIPDQQHDALKMVGTAFQTDPIRSQLAFANQAGVTLDVEIERKWIRDLTGVAHGLPYQGNHALSSILGSAILTAA